MNGPVVFQIQESIFSNSFGYTLNVKQNDMLQISSSLTVRIINVTITSIKVPELPKLGTDPIIGIYSHLDGPQMISITDIKFHNNQLQGSTVMKVLNCALNFSGYNVISNNTALSSNGGGLAIEGTGYMFGGPNTTLIFSNNKANFGGAIYFSHNERDYGFCTINNIYPKFINNSAHIAGNDIYGGTFTNCINTLPFHHIAPSWNICRIIRKHFHEDISSSISSDPFSIYICNGRIRTNNISTTISIIPGQTAPLTLSTTGYCNNFSPGYIAITTSEGLHIETDLQTQQIGSPCKELYHSNHH